MLLNARDKEGVQVLLAAVLFGVRTFKSPAVTPAERAGYAEASALDAAAILAAIDQLPLP